MVVCFLCDYILAEVHNPVFSVGLQLESSSLSKMNVLIMNIKGCGLLSLQEGQALHCCEGMITTAEVQRTEKENKDHKGYNYTF